MYFQAPSAEKSRSDDIVAQRWLQSSIKGPGLPGETLDPSAGAQKVQDGLRTANYAKKQEKWFLKILRAYQKDIGKQGTSH